MDILLLKDKIIKIINSNPKTFPRILKKELPQDIWDLINNHSGKTISEKVYRLYVEDKKCESCGNDASFISFSLGCKPTCNDKKCWTLIREKRNLEKFGFAYSFQNPITQEKISKINSEKTQEEKIDRIRKIQTTCVERYGSESPLGSDLIKEKIKQTNLEKYGSESPLGSDLIKEKIKQTNLEKYGVENLFNLVEIQNQIKQTNLEKYGVEYYSQTDLFGDQLKETSNEKYGKNYYSQTDEFKSRVKQTNLEKYGFESWSQQPEARNKLSSLIKDSLANNPEITNNRSKTKRNNYLQTLLLRSNVEFLSSEYLGIFETHQWRCLSCQTKFYYQIGQKSTVACPICRPKGRSSAERDLNSLISNLGFTVKSGDRTVIKPLELDLFILENNIAIEYCGLYWHSEISGEKPKNYHANKLKMCSDKSIRLVTIFEDEWRFKKDIVIARLNHLMGKSVKICGARQTTIQEISTTECRNFLELYHIQGFVASSVKLGAFFENKLVAVMSFGKRRKALGGKSKDGNWELLRFATAGNIPGIANKLLKYFEKNYNPKILISYCDLRWGVGKVYSEMGFAYSHTSKPNYWYLNGYDHRQYRFTFRKDQLIAGGFDKEKSEWEIMQERGYDRIWDCGNSVWKKIY
jgi:hypothetical protein